MIEIVLVLAILAAIAAGSALRYAAYKERKRVVDRLTQAGEMDPGYSPTAELFKGLGIPPVDAVDDAAELQRAVREQPLLKDLPSMDLVREQTPLASVSKQSEEQSTAAPSALGNPAHSVTDLLEGFAPPAGLHPAGNPSTNETSYASQAPIAVVIAGLDEEFERLGCVARWNETGEAFLSRNGIRGSVTVVGSSHSRALSDTNADDATFATIRSI